MILWPAIDRFHHGVRGSVDDGDTVAVRVRDVNELARLAGGHPARMESGRDRLEFIPRAILQGEDRDAAVIAKARARIDADRRFRGRRLRIALLRMIAAPVADVGTVGSWEDNCEWGNANGHDSDHGPGGEIDLLDVVAAR